jgi:hypothetical protein
MGGMPGPLCHPGLNIRRYARETQRFILQGPEQSGSST